MLTDTETEEPTQDEEAFQVFHWRIRGLVEEGFTLRQARLLAVTPDVVHDAATLLAHGCPVDEAFRLLR